MWVWAREQGAQFTVRVGGGAGVLAGHVDLHGTCGRCGMDGCGPRWVRAIRQVLTLPDPVDPGGYRITFRPASCLSISCGGVGWSGETPCLAGPGRGVRVLELKK
ncbi:hypothetical protein GCM10008939_27700 [Deinococcus aquiradiocola]|uniref:Uncharacterized protein n=1 Tax=Deinococcus aquiradiocola TaxID=393059 RepID=A0A917USL3_9DEIO|nr:hypothetical protein GCM10008939_27700 [Deinococcus aquiradiocola]